MSSSPKPLEIDKSVNFLTFSLIVSLLLDSFDKSNPSWISFFKLLIEKTVEKSSLIIFGPSSRNNLLVVAAPLLEIVSKNRFKSYRTIKDTNRYYKENTYWDRTQSWTNR